MSTEKSTVSLAEFWAMLNAHDWFYSYSDDPRAYNRGRANEEKLKAIAKSSSAHNELYQSFEAYLYNEDVEKPERPS